MGEAYALRNEVEVELLSEEGEALSKIDADLSYSRRLKRALNHRHHHRRPRHTGN